MCAQRDRKPGFDSEFDGVSLRIRLRGEIDHHTAAVVRVSIDELIRSRAPRVLLLDMSAVDFMDSSGLGLIMGRLERAEHISARLNLTGLSPTICKLIRLSGIDRLKNLSIENKTVKEITK